MVWPTMLKPKTDVKPNTPGQSISKETNSNEGTENYYITEPDKETKEEWYHHKRSMKTNAEYNKQKIVDPNEDLLGTDIPFTK